MSLRARIDVIVQRVTSAPARALPRAAARIQGRLRGDATTKRGNVPAFGELGGPIVAEPTSDGVAVRAPGWVHDVAEKRGQPATWAEDLADEMHRALDEGH